MVDRVTYTVPADAAITVCAVWTGTENGEYCVENTTTTLDLGPVVAPVTPVVNEAWWRALCIQQLIEDIQALRGLPTR